MLTDSTPSTSETSCRTARSQLSQCMAGTRYVISGTLISFDASPNERAYPSGVHRSVRHGRRAARACLSVSVHDQDVAVRLPRDRAADAHPERTLHERALVRSQHDEVGVHLVCDLEDHVRGIAVFAPAGRRGGVLFV